MLCILCVATSEQVIHIFQDKGRALNINEIIVKHFWLQPNAKDENAKVICTSCWTALDSFHKFYLQVEEAHLKLLRSSTIEQNEMKLENETSVPEYLWSKSDQICDTDISSNIKLEIQEDFEEIPPLEVSSIDIDIKTEPIERSPLMESKISMDESPTASFSGTGDFGGSTISNENEKYNFVKTEDSNPSTDQNSDSDSDDGDVYNDSDYEAIEMKANKQQELLKIKRGRPKEGELGEPFGNKKQLSDEVLKNIQRSKEYDEIIAEFMELSCTHCLVVFPNFADLKKHYRLKHNECGYVMCCGNKLGKRGVLVDHIYTHKNPDYFKCEKCGKVSTTRRGLSCHLLTHDTEKQRNYHCEQCPKSFYTKSLLTQHTQTHSLERNIKCPQCGKFFSTQGILRKHIHNIHNPAYTKICNQCGKQFRQPDAFRKHQLKHDGPLVPCEECEVKLTSKSALKLHMEAMHSETKVEHVCSTCGKVASTAAALQRHVTYMHSMERKHKCPMCDKAFKKRNNLKPNKDDENTRFICCSCWNALDSFHKFYQQVEEAHITLAKTTAAANNDLKQETDQIAAQPETEDVDKFDPCAAFLTADVKLEVKEDAEVNLPQSDPLPDIEEKIEVNQIEKNKRKATSDSDDSDDSESEIPLANLAKTPSKRIKSKTRRTAESSSEDRATSAEWQDAHSDDDDDDEDDEDDDESDFEVKKPPPKLKALTKTGKKRGRPCKNAPKVITPKQTTEEQIKKRELSQEYDEIIQKNMKLSCNLCMVPLANFLILKKHYRAKHNERGYASCCGKKFLKRGILVDHIYTHLNPEHFKCEKCDKVLADRRCLEVHMNTHITEKQRIYQCDQCCKSFFKKPLLTRHLHIHIPEEERKFPCEECNKFFPSNYTLRAHVNNVHQNAYAKICDQCGKSIRGREAFQRHLLEHAGIPIPSVQCDKCGAKLKNKYGLKRHMNSMHAETNVPHVCNICGKVAPNSAALQRHYSYVHKCERNHKCPMCDKAFKKAGGLKEHMTTHTGEVLYTCPHCPKTFNSNANMHSHRKKMHRKEWEENRRHPHIWTTSTAE